MHRNCLFLIFIFYSILGISVIFIPEFQTERAAPLKTEIFPVDSQLNTEINQEHYETSLALEFWKNSLPFVESVPLELKIETSSDVTYQNRHLIIQKVSYNSPNWINQEKKTIRIKANLIYRAEFESAIGQLPGILLMHGITSNKEAMLEIAEELCLYNYTVLIPDHPGHGESEGAVPTVENIFFEGIFNESSHYYLTTAAAIQGIRALENTIQINSSQIMVSGFSYGGLNSMYVGGVYSDHIRAVLPMSAIGGFNQSNIENSLFLMLGARKKEINAQFWKQNIQYFDPLYYLQNPNYPPIVWMAGTHDMIFLYEEINMTYNLSPKNLVKYLQIHPNAHHGVSNMEATMNYFIRWCLNEGLAPPDIVNTNQKIKTDFFGDTVQVQIRINSAAIIREVKVTYRYTNLFGDPWKSNELQLRSTNGSSTEWSGIIPKGVISSVIEYYFTINMKGDGDVWFTSQIFSAGRIRNHLSLLGIILWGVLISYPIQLILKRKYIHEYHEIQKKYHPKNQHQIKKTIIWELLFVLESEALIITAFWLPWVTQNNGITVTLGYIIERSFAWSDFEVSLLLYMPAFYVFFVIFAGINSLRKPFAGGIMNLMTPMLILLVFSADMLSIGFYIQVIMAISQIAFGEWKEQVVVSLLEDNT